MAQSNATLAIAPAPAANQGPPWAVIAGLTTLVSLLLAAVAAVVVAGAAVVAFGAASFLLLSVEEPPPPIAFEMPQAVETAAVVGAAPRLKKLKANAGDSMRFANFRSRRTGAEPDRKVRLRSLSVTSDQGSFARSF